MREPVSVTPDSRAEMVQALRQVVSAPRIEYMRFDGDPIKYVSFMHNFETCLEKDNPDNSRAQLFEGRLALNPGFSFLCSKAFSRIIFSVIFRAFNHQLVDKKN